MRTLNRIKSVLIALVPLKAQYLWNFYREMKRRDDEAYAVYQAQRALAKAQLKQIILGTFRRHRRQKKTISANPPKSRGVHRILDRLDMIAGKLKERDSLAEPRNAKFAASYAPGPLDPIIRRPGDDGDQPSSSASAKQTRTFKILAGQSPTTPVADVLRYEVARGSKDTGRSDLGASAFGPLRPDTELREIIDGTGLRLDPLGRTTELVPVASAT